MNGDEDPTEGTNSVFRETLYESRDILWGTIFNSVHIK